MLYPDLNELIALASKRGELDVKSNRKMLSSAAGNYASPFRGQGLAFHGVREYRPGDDIRHIDWRVTARVNKPHMKVFTEDRERTVLICVDANATMRFGTRGTFKSVQAARAAALIGWFANGSHDRVGGFLFGDVPKGTLYFRPTRSRRSLWQALSRLSQKPAGEPFKPFRMEAALRELDQVAPTGSLIFIISDFYLTDEAVEKALGSLQRRCDIVLVRVNDPADGHIPPIGVVRFTDSGGAQIDIDTDNRFGQDAYRKSWQDNNDRFDAIRKRRGLHVIELQTKGDVHVDLISGLRRLALWRGK